MRKSEIDFKKIPDAPGVYFFFGSKKEMLYIGKATSLRDRVKSYFDQDIAEIRSPLIEKIVRDTVSLKFEQTDSVLEALILEAKLIKKHMPPGNSAQKDNKSWNYVVITRERFPRLMVVRERELDVRFPKETRRELFGPFTAGGALKEGLKIIRRIFPYFDPPFPVDEGSRRQAQVIGFNQAIGLYPREFNEREYAKTVRAITDILSGRKKVLITRLEREMRAHARKHEFEQADVVKRQVFALTHIRDVTMIKEELKSPTTATFRVEAYDTAHTAGSTTRAVMVVVENGEAKKSDYRVFTIRGAVAGDDYAALAEVLTRRMNHREWPYPQLVVIDGGKTHLALAKKTLATLDFHGDVVAVVKDERHRQREVLGTAALTTRHEAAILLANAEAHRFAIGRHRSAFRKRGFLQS